MGRGEDFSLNSVCVVRNFDITEYSIKSTRSFFLFYLPIEENILKFHIIEYSIKSTSSIFLVYLPIEENILNIQDIL